VNKFLKITKIISVFSVLMLTLEWGGADVGRILANNEETLTQQPDITTAEYSGDNESNLGVLHTSPQNGTTNVTVTNAVYLAFDQHIQSGEGFDQITFKSDDEDIRYSATITEHELHIIPEDQLQYASTYSLYIPTNAIADLSGNYLSVPFLLDFTTEDSPLHVVSTNPTNGEMEFPFDQEVIITFNKSVHSSDNFSLMTFKQEDKLVSASYTVQDNHLIVTPEFGLSPNATYSINLPEDAVQDNSGSSNSNFSFAFTTSDDTYEPNNSEETAYGITTGNQYISSISEPWESDYYVFTADESGDVTVTVKVPDNCNYDVRVESMDKQLRMTSHQGTGEEEELTFRVIAGETYHIAVYDAYSSVHDSVKYTLDVSGITPPINDTFEPNDRISEAYEVQAGNIYESAISAVGDKDYYMFTAPESGAVKLDLTPASGGRYQTTLINESTGLSYKSATSYGEASSLHFYAQEGDTYTILVDGNNRYTSEYVLQIGSVDSNIVDTYETNDGTPYEVEPGQSYSSYLSVPNDRDNYTFTPSVSGNIAVDLIVPADKNYDLFMSSVAKSDRSESGRGEPERIEMSVQAGTSYTIEVSGGPVSEESYGEETYLLQLSEIETGYADSYEPNNTLGQAYVIEPATDYEALIPLPYDQDYYTFTPEEEGIGRVTLIVPEQVNYDVGIVEEDYRTIARGTRDQGEKEEVFFRFKAGTKYTIQIHGSSATEDHGPIPYQFRLELSSNVDRYENNDLIEAAIPIERGIHYESYLAVQGDIDYFKYEAEMDAELTLSYAMPEGNNYLMEIYNAAGNRVWWTISEDDIKIPTEIGEVYYIKVYGLSEDDHGDDPYVFKLGYTLDIPQNLHISNHFGSSATLSWDALDDSWGSVTYDVYRDDVYLLSTTHTMIELDGLNSGAMTAFTLKAGNAIDFDSPASSAVHVLEFGDDLTPPSKPTIQLTPTDEWANGDVEVVVQHGEDAYSGVFKSQYKIGIDGTWTDYNEPLAIGNEGETRIYARTLDNAGNSSEEATATVKIDQTAPTQPIITLSASDWTNEAVTVSIASGNDSGSGVQNSQYKLGAEGTWIDYTEAITISTEGETEVFARTLDYVGNVSEAVTATVRIDQTTPTQPTISLSTSEWTNEGVVVIVSSGTDSGSGVLKTEYKHGEEGTWTTYTDSFPIGTEGESIVYARTIDIAGNASEESTAVAKVDRTAPTESIITLSANDWTNEAVTVSIASGTDSGSGVQNSQYKLGAGGTWTDYTEAITISTQGETEVFARTLDYVGNVSEEATATLRIDQTAPTQPTIALSTSEWTSEEVIVSIAAGEDIGSGTLVAQYKLGVEGPWSDYIAPFSISTDGESIVYARAVDIAGNISGEATALAKVDRTAPTKPVITLSSDDWTNEAVTVNIASGTDSGSGVLTSQYKLGAEGAWTTYTEAISINTEGETVVFARTIDIVGNLSEEATVTVRIDQTAPTQPTIALSTSEWTSEDVIVTITPGQDSGSGVWKSQYKLGEGGEWTNYIAPFTINEEGEAMIYARTLDHTGKVSNETSALVKIDRTLPSVPIDVTLVQISEDNLRMKWKHATDNVGLLGYRVYNGTTLLGLVEETEVNLTGIVGASSYQFSVKAVDEAGNESAPSNRVRFTTYRQPIYYYDPQGSGQLQRVEYEDGTIVRFEYDPNGNLIRTYYED